jgi:hypothetical protein
MKDERIGAIRARLEAATPGKSWINLLQSNGCEVSLFDKTYTVWLTARGGEFKQTERDGELLANAPADLAWLLDEVERLREALRELLDRIPELEEFEDRNGEPMRDVVLRAKAALDGEGDK